MAARRRASESACLARVGGPLQGDRRHPPAGALRFTRRPRRTRRGDRRRIACVVGPGRHRRRPAAFRLHLLPPGARRRRAGRADPARGVRPEHRSDRARVPDAGADARAAHHARQGEDPRRAHRVPGAGTERTAAAARQRAARDLPRVQRRLRGRGGRIADAPRSVGRSDPARPVAGGTAARAGGDWAARADAADRSAARRAHHACRRPRAAGRSGSFAVEPRADRRRAGASSAYRFHAR